MQDIELMHMRYTLESVVLALGVMERSVTGETQSSQQSARCHLKDLRNHLEAITNVPRKVITCKFIFLLFFFFSFFLFFSWVKIEPSLALC